MATIYTHISLLEPLSLRSLLDSEAYSGCLFSLCCHLFPSSDRLKEHIISEVFSHYSFQRSVFLCCNMLLWLECEVAHVNAIQSTGFLKTHSAPSIQLKNKLIDQRKIQQILSSHSRWSFGWQQMVHWASPTEIKILSMHLQISPGTKTKMKLRRFAMREQWAVD